MEKSPKEILDELFLDKLSLEKSLKEIIKKKIHPFDNWNDYVKYGDMFLTLNLNQD